MKSMIYPIHSQTHRIQRVVKKRLSLLCTGLIALLLVTALLWPAARESAKALCNQLFDASESVNSYVYDHFTVAEGSGTSLAAFIAAGTLLLWALVLVLQDGVFLALLTAALLAGAQIYFGLSLPAWVNIVCFAALGLLILYRMSGEKALLPAMATLLVLTLAVILLLPGTNPLIEQASEQVRDLLGTAPMQELSEEAAEQQPLAETRHENRRSFTEGEGEALDGQDFRLVTVAEQQIALPHWIDYLRIIVLCILIPVLLAAPFVPFVWMNRRAVVTAARRDRLEADDPREVIDAAFRLVIGYLDACGIGQSNALYIDRLAGPDPRLPEDYPQLYRQCAQIWQEACYSHHEMTPAQRGLVLQLLDATEAALYDPADWKQRLRMKYVFCLHE